MLKEAQGGRHEEILRRQASTFCLLRLMYMVTQLKVRLGLRVKGALCERQLFFGAKEPELWAMRCTKTIMCTIIRLTKPPEDLQGKVVCMDHTPGVSWRRHRRKIL